MTDERTGGTAPGAQAANMTPLPISLGNAVIGAGLVAVTLLVIFREWGSLDWLTPYAVPLVLPPVLALLTIRVRPSRRIFVAVALALTLIGALSVPEWSETVLRALQTAAFIAAFFAALATLRNAAESSPAIEECGAFLARQPPGRRYAALTVGGQMFALLLNYGAIALLGGLALANARQEPDPEIRAHRIRRMLLAIQRGFVSVLPWSPLSFAVAVTTVLVPGTTWSKALLPSLVTGGIIAGLGWFMDSVFKPRLSGPTPARRKPEGSWTSALPLLGLLALLSIAVLVLHELTPVRVPGLVIVVVPLIALGWVALQARGGGTASHVVARSRDYVFRELPAYADELILLTMAGYIGTVGAALLGPVVAQSHLDLTGLPTPAVLLAVVWLIPLAGQVGMNPIMVVSLLVPLLPGAAQMGITPTALMIAVTAGWVLSAICSPFTATTLLIGSFGGLTARQVGLRWNGAYLAAATVLLSAWVLLYAGWTAPGG